MRGVIAIDGKTLRGSRQNADGTGALHLVQAYAHEAGVVLASCATRTKSNEITAIPELLEMIDIHGAIVTIDAMGTQTAIADKIIKGGGDYVLALKGNHSSLHEDVADWFADPALTGASQVPPQILANIRRLALNMLKQNPLNMSIKRKRLKALINPSDRAQILAC